MTDKSIAPIDHPWTDALDSARALRQQTFASLANLNYRRYFSGQAVSLIGTWMQTIAQGWLVLQLTGSGTLVGLVVALQTLPVLLLGPYAGVIADRMDKRLLMIALQAIMGVLALALGVLVLSGTVRLWHVYALALLLGVASCFENPVRQTFVMELVGPEDLRNAVSLNSVLMNVARAVGPTAAGLIIAAGGTGLCFLINAVSFLAVIYSLVTLDAAQLRPATPAVRAKGQLREGLRYVRRTPELAVPLAMMGIIGALAYEFQVVLPVFAKDDLGGGANTYGFLTGAMGIGAVAGGLWVAAKGRTGTRSLIVSSALFGLAITAAALAPGLGTAIAAMAIVGATSVGVLSKGNSTLQLASEPQMRGRVMALWAVAFLGTTPVGGPIAGFIAETFGGRAALAMGAVACFAAAGLGLWALRRLGLAAAGPAGGAEPAARHASETR